MKQSKWMLLSLLLALTVSSCFIDINDDPFGNGDCIRGQGSVVSEEIDLNRIDAIDLKLPGTVYLRQGAEQRVVVEAQANIIDNLERTVRGGLWEVSVDGCVDEMEDLRIYLTVPTLTALKISSNGRISGDTPFEVDDLELGIDGSGDINLSLKADDVIATINGSGNLRLDGAADEMRFKLVGSGDLRAFGLTARKASLEISGSGDAEVMVTEELNVMITGSGDVFYHGRPSLNVTISGSGGVVDAN